jgi:Xaa-Pro dipeptidase
MQRREFLAAMGAVLVTGRSGGSADVGAWHAMPLPPTRLPAHPSQEPVLSPEVFSRRIERAQAELKTRKWDLFIATPGANYLYFTGYHPGRSERMIALIVPAVGDAAIVCPAFEVDRIKAHTSLADIQGWDERDNPYKLIEKVVRARKPRGTGTVALESSTAFDAYLGFKDALGGWKFADAGPLTERLRSVKLPEEIELLRRAIAITEDALAATFAQLAVGVSERDVARVLAAEMRRRDAEGGGLVQFGPSSALPHGGPAGATLGRETVVLIDCGCRVAGYTSDITRTVWFGDQPPREFTTVFNLVHDAQTAAIQLGKPLFTRGEEMDRVARKVIADGGYGPNFTHRLGHGIGLDGHEPPYLVEGNETRLEPGMVFTIEPGIYQAGKFGVRIEDDCVMTESGVEVLSHRPSKL